MCFFEEEGIAKQTGPKKSVKRTFLFKEITVTFRDGTEILA